MPGIGPGLTLSHDTQSIMKIDIPHHLSDEELESQLKSLARGEREATARLIAHLAEFDERRLYRAAGFPSLFNYG